MNEEDVDQDISEFARLSCGHRFHAKCISDRRIVFCPLCRGIIWRHGGCDSVISDPNRGCTRCNKFCNVVDCKSPVAFPVKSEFYLHHPPGLCFSHMSSEQRFIWSYRLRQWLMLVLSLVLLCALIILTGSLFATIHYAAIPYMIWSVAVKRTSPSFLEESIPMLLCAVWKSHNWTYLILAAWAVRACIYRYTGCSIRGNLKLVFGVF